MCKRLLIFQLKQSSNWYRKVFIVVVVYNNSRMYENLFTAKDLNKFICKF